MPNRCRNHNKNNSGDGILANIMMSIVSTYLLVFGKNEKQ